MSANALSFKSPAGAAEYLQAYNAVLTLWPVAHESHYIETSHGVTHVVTAGPEGAPPIVLLHAYAFSSAEWYANVEALSANHRVYAVDVMGDMNQTVMKRPFKQRAELAVWLRELFDALGIAKAVLMGHSYGGWLTLNFAMQYPERLTKIVLLAPAASFVPMVGQFTLRRILAFILPKWFLPAFGRWSVAPGNPVPVLLLEQMRVAMRQYKFTSMVLQPDVYTDAELAQIKTPALVVVGEHEVIYNPAKAVERAQRTVAGLQVRMIPGASHALLMEQPAAVNEAILSFVQG